MAIDCACLRYLDTISLTQGQETYTLSTVSAKGVRAIDVLNVTVLWGQTRVPLNWAVWTQFNAMFRTWQTNQSRPAVWSNYGPGPSMVIYVQPVPDQTYTCYLDTKYVPVALVDNTTVDELVYPWTSPVKYYAAAQAKYKMQAYGEQQGYMEQYKMKAIWAINSFERRLPSAYDAFVG